MRLYSALVVGGSGHALSQHRSAPVAHAGGLLRQARQSGARLADAHRQADLANDEILVAASEQ